jgi:hypothetical protein
MGGGLGKGIGCPGGGGGPGKADTWVRPYPEGGSGARSQGDLKVWKPVEEGPAAGVVATGRSLVGVSDQIGDA